jgi:CheY-like chemotaxis protein
VLVVDDDKLTRSIMVKMLSKMGHNVASAHSGRTALEMAIARQKAGTPFNVIFSDNQMPEEGSEAPIFGIEAIRRCAYRSAVTSFNMESECERLAFKHSYAASAAIQKPETISSKLVRTMYCSNLSP